MRNIRFLGRISEIFSEKSSTFRWNVENYKEELEWSFRLSFIDLLSTESLLTCFAVAAISSASANRMSSPTGNTDCSGSAELSELWTASGS